ncbi:uncharacterized protein LOC127789034 isoform X1 [Diospyros lotus]|uniref:uncharacterized protein LOC127789034 isoform X1 n=1 Tax=Diospyros lotus TaxID=55363 RepID=UPI00224E36BD|nr:uncharacterized protein LOC127789034 isoform X1 [Diospyros lotus]
MEEPIKHREEAAGLEYWLRWQVPVCALIILLPFAVAIRILRREEPPPPLLAFSATHLWLPCWKNLNPLWLLFFRAFAFASMAFLLYHIVALLRGLFAFYFYTQWTFALVTIYFALATFISARGCWIHSRKRFTDETMSSEFLKKSSKENESDGTSFLNPEETNHAIKSQSHHSKKANVHTVGFLEHLMQAIYQTCAGAVMLTDIVFWCLLVPFLLGDKFQLTLLIGSIHSVNAVFLILDSVLNSQPLTWYGLPYFVIWSVSYVVFQWILHACGFTWWPYPFLELSTPWAPLWYFALALVHLPCYGIYVLLVKAKVWTFSRIFPNAFLRPVNASSRNSMEKKQT